MAPLNLNLDIRWRGLSFTLRPLFFILELLAPIWATISDYG